MPVASRAMIAEIPRLTRARANRFNPTASFSRRQFAALSVSGECVPSIAGASKGLRNIGSGAGRQL